MVSVTDTADKTTSRAYNPLGTLNRTTDTAGNIVTATYDVRGRNKARRSRASQADFNIPRAAA